MTPDMVVKEARRWVGRPFLHQGHSWSGVDCVGLVIAVCSALGLLPDKFSTGIYGRMPTNDMLTKRIASHCQNSDHARPGSIVVIRWTHEASHVAICTGDTLIHSYEKVGRVVEHGYRGRWISMTSSVWVLPGVTYE